MLRWFILLFLLFFNLEARIPKGILIVVVENEISGTNPTCSEDHDAVINLVFSGLTRFDERMSLKPNLAVSWNVSRGGLSYDIFLREDVSWHGGVEFSADDVKFSLEASENPKNSSSAYANFKDIKSIEILNPYHLKIALSKPSPAFLDTLGIGMFPEHLLSDKDLSTTSSNQNPIGTGPYKLAKWKKDEYVELKANENFYLTGVKTLRLVIEHIFDPSVASIGLKNGKVDAALIDVSLLNIFKKDEDFKILRERSADHRALMLSLENEFLKGVQIRKTLNYAVDKQSIVESLLHDYGFVASHPLERSWADSKAFKTYEYNPKRAQDLILVLGFKKSDEDIFGRDGKILELEIWTMSNDPLRVSLTGILQSEFRKIGVIAKVVAKPTSSFDYFKADSLLVSWGSPLDPDFYTFRVFESSQDSTLNNGGWNFGHYHDKKVDIVLQEAGNTLNLEGYKKRYKEFIDALYENPPFIFLAYLDFTLIYNAKLESVRARNLDHHGVGFTWNIYEWSKK